MKKVFVVGGDLGYANWLRMQTVKELEEADLVLFTGGEDVDPTLYNEPEGKWTFTNPERDAAEVSVFNRALELGMPMLGICRGSQLLCVLSGGRLVQDQDNPFPYHNITTYDGREVMISSTHHQAQYPYDMPEDEYQVLAWTDDLNGHHFNGNDEEISPVPFREVEICYYPKTRCLGIQGHPEYMNRHAYPETFEFLDMLVEGLMTGTLSTKPETV